jgi:membrane-associated HD superfamily phosphohydrolase
MRKLSQRRLTLSVVALFLLASLTLLTAVPVFADVPSGGAGAMVAGAVFLVTLMIAVAGYIYFAMAVQSIAKKTNTENAWWAWVPVLQIVLTIFIAKKPVWWIALCFIPLVNIVIMIIIWMAIAEARNKPSWWGILLIVPVVNLIVPGYLAWSD